MCLVVSELHQEGQERSPGQSREGVCLICRRHPRWGRVDQRQQQETQTADNFLQGHVYGLLDKRQRFVRGEVDSVAKDSDICCSSQIYVVSTQWCGHTLCTEKEDSCEAARHLWRRRKFAYHQYVPWSCGHPYICMYMCIYIYIYITKDSDNWQLPSKTTPHSAGIFSCVDLCVRVRARAHIH